MPEETPKIHSIPISITPRPVAPPMYTNATPPPAPHDVHPENVPPQSAQASSHHFDHFSHHKVIDPSQATGPSPAPAPGQPINPKTLTHQTIPTTKSPKHAKKATAKDEKKIRKLSRGAASRDSKEYFVENLSMLLSTEVTVSEALTSIAKEMPSRKVKAVLEEMIRQIDDGVPFWKSISDTGLLPGSAVALIKIGEESGRLPDNLKVVSDQMHKNNMLASKIHSALLYPTFLVVLLFLVGSGVGLFLLPRLAGIFKGLNAKLGLMTRILISFGTFYGKWGLVLTGAFVAFLIIVTFAIRTFRPLRDAGERVLFVLPGVKQLLFESEMARFGFILGSLLEAGLPVTDALTSLTDSMSTKRYKTLAFYFKSSIELGNSFAKSLDNMKHKNYIPGPVRQLIVSAEKSGNLAPTLIKAGTIYEDKADVTARNLETMIEPVILVVIAVVVLFVALSVFLPIYSLVGTLSNS